MSALMLDTDLDRLTADSGAGWRSAGAGEKYGPEKAFKFVLTAEQEQLCPGFGYVCRLYE